MPTLSVNHDTLKIQFRKGSIFSHGFQFVPFLSQNFSDGRLGSRDGPFDFGDGDFGSG